MTAPTRDQVVQWKDNCSVSDEGEINLYEFAALARADLEAAIAAEQSKVKVLTDALNNCRLLAARHRKEEWAGHVFRFCHAAGVTASALRGAEREALATVKDNSKPTLICPRCKVDRFSEPCPGPLHMCPIVGDAQ